MERLGQFQDRVELTLHGANLSIAPEESHLGPFKLDHIQLTAQLRLVLGPRFVRRLPPGHL